MTDGKSDTPRVDALDEDVIAQTGGKGATVEQYHRFYMKARKLARQLERELNSATNTGRKCWACGNVAHPCDLPECALRDGVGVAKLDFDQRLLAENVIERISADEDELREFVYGVIAERAHSSPDHSSDAKDD